MRVEIMSANVATGTVKSVRYCGHEYTVRPGEIHGQKQAWIVFCGDEQLSKFTPTRSRAVRKIHEHAVEIGSFPSQKEDGATYEKLVSSVCR